jgi:hypothetical protein
LKASWIASPKSLTGLKLYPHRWWARGSRSTALTTRPRSSLKFDILRDYLIRGSIPAPSHRIKHIFPHPFGSP